MEIKHRIGFNVNKHPNLKDLLDQLSIDYETQNLPGNSMLVYFDISEGDSRWETLGASLEGVSDIVYTIFSKEEILEANWVRLIPTFQSGFPEPQNEWIVKPHNYNIECQVCGLFSQVSSFSILNEPDLKGNSFMSLHWAYPLFCTEKVLEVFNDNNISGYDIWDVSLIKPKKTSAKIKQLKLLSFSRPGLIKIQDFGSNICQECGKEKFKPHKRGLMLFSQKAFENIKIDFLLSSEWFGDKRVAYREIIASNKVVRLILEHDWKGVSLRPIKLI